MTRFVLIAPLIVLASMAQVSAQQQQQPGHDACARDVTRHCRAVMNDGDQAVLACLKQNRARISKGCDKVLVEHGQ
jgi:Cysteine rich repeat